MEKNASAKKIKTFSPSEINWENPVLQVVSIWQPYIICTAFLNM